MLYSSFKFYTLAILLLLVSSCKTAKVGKQPALEIAYVDNYVIPAGMMLQNTEVGGLSGITYDGSNFFAVSDQASNPRFYKLDIQLSANKIDTVLVNDLIRIKDTAAFFKTTRLDLEDIAYDSTKDAFIFSTEGSIMAKKDPAIFITIRKGNYINHYQIPVYFKAESEQKPRHNGLFEGLSLSSDKKGIWVANELPLEADGPEPKLYRTKSPVRFTYFDSASKKPQKQFSYRLEPIDRIPLMPFSVNGLSGILNYKPDKFLVLERSFSAGRGKKANTILLFHVNAKNASPTLQIPALEGKIEKEVKSAEKELVFNFKKIRKLLQGNTVDNIEGICFGPILANGNQSLLVIADNNFNSFSEQLNQIILLEIKNL